MRDETALNAALAYLDLVEPSWARRLDLVWFQTCAPASDRDYMAKHALDEPTCRAMRIVRQAMMMAGSPPAPPLEAAWQWAIKERRKT